MADYTAQIESIYLAYYGRPADVTGLAYWNTALNTANGDLASIINSFGTSAEATSLYSSSSNIAKINAIYVALFNRSADAEGLIYYAGLLDNGTKSQASIALDILNGATGDDLTLITKKLVVSADFTAAMQNDATAMIAYAGTTAATTARSMLSAVTATSDDSGVVSTTLTTIETVTTDTTTAAAQTFTLTTSDAGDKTGDTGDDLFIALDDALQNYVVDGAAGNDTLRATISATESYSVSNVESLSFKTTADATIDLSDFSGETSILVRGSTAGVDTVLSNVEAGTALTSELTSTTTLTATLDDATGSADSITLTLDDATSTGATTLDDIETINIVSDGSGNSLTLAADSVVTLDISGDADLTVVSVTAADLETIDASAATGDLTFTLLPALDLTFTSGSGDDSATMGAAAVSLDDSDTIDMGAGDDTLTLIATGATTYLSSAEDGDIAVSNVETLELVADGADTIDFDVFADPTEFTTVLVTSTLDAATITLTDIQQTAISIRNTDNVSVSDTITTVTYDKKDGTSATDTLTVTLTNRDDTENFTVGTLSAALIESITIDAAFSGDDEDVTITTLTATALETLTITGAADLTITGALSATVETVNGAAATGDIAITLGTSDTTVTGGAGNDTFVYAEGGITEDDEVSGGTGNDEVQLLGVNDGTVLDFVVDFTSIETLTFTEDATSDESFTADMRNSAATTTFNVTFEGTGDDTVTFENIGGSSTVVNLAGITDADGDTLVLSLDDDGTADSLTINIATDTAGGALAFEGTITANDYETITIDAAGTDGGTDDEVLLLADLNASSATTYIFTNDDTYDAGDNLVITAALDGENSTVDLSGWGQDIGADAGTNALTAGGFAADEQADILGQFTAGLTFAPAEDVTVILSDGRTSATHETIISLGLLATQAGIDIIEFVNLSSDSTDDIGDVVISLGFTARNATTGTASNHTKIDLSAFTDIDSISDITITATPSDDPTQNTILTSDLFAGVIVLMGVTASELTADNFIFA